MEKFRPHAEPLKACNLLLESIQDPLLVVNDGGLILYANRTARRAFEFEILGRMDDLRCKDESSKSSFDPREVFLLVEKRTSIANHRLKTPDGLDSDTLLDIDLFFSDKNLGTVKLLHFKDFSEFKNSERWKDETIAMVSHELKNPLSAMKNVVNLLLSQAPGPLTPEQRRFLLTSKRSIERLTHLVESILDVSRLSAGRLEVNPSWIGLQEFMVEVVSGFKTLFNVDRVDLNLDVGSEIDKIYVDSTKLEQVLINLMSNALKFTQEKGRIDVIVGLAGREMLSDDFRLLPWDDLPQPLFAHFLIRDTGIGMTGDTLANLYTRYYKDDRCPQSQGSHLGLNISKMLIELQGGSLNVESKLGIGTEVSFSLPLDERTGYILESLNIVKMHLEKLRRKERAFVFFTLGKESGECWRSLCGGWPVIPEMNIGKEAANEEGFFLWALSEYIAVGLISGDELVENPFSLFDADARHTDGESMRFDSYATGLARAGKDGNRLEQLFNISLRRMKQAESLVSSRP